MRWTGTATKGGLFIAWVVGNNELNIKKMENSSTMTEREQEAVFGLIIRHISDLADMRDKMTTEDGKKAITEEMEFFRGIIGKIPTND